MTLPARAGMLGVVVASAELHADLAALVGTVIGDRYRVDALIGTGGMGAVFKGYHTGLGREVAIKLLHPDLGRDETVAKRFDREAHSASRLDHPNCVRVTDYGTTQAGARYLVMDYLDGEELKASMATPRTPLAAVRIAKQILLGLEHAHSAGLVHRDIKPENVFLTRGRDGEALVKLVDFGIAKLLDQVGQTDLTRAGLVFGTPKYMSPEQAMGRKIDERTDLYATGVILYGMLAGRLPFVSTDPAQLLRMQVMAAPPALPRTVPASLAAVVGKLLEKVKADRYPSAREALTDLDRVEQELIEQPALAASLADDPTVADIESLGAETPMPVRTVEAVPDSSPTGRKTWLAIGLGVVAVVSLAGVAWMLVDPSLMSSEGEREPAEAPVPEPRELSIGDPLPPRSSTIGPFAGADDRNRGEWQARAMCPPGTWVTGASLRISDTALDGIRLNCANDVDPDDREVTVISSGEGHSGEWEEAGTCPGNFVTGAALRIAPPQGAADGMFTCPDGIELRGTTRDALGEWKPKQECPAGAALCGLETRIEAGLNDARFVCCPYVTRPRTR